MEVNQLAQQLGNWTAGRGPLHRRLSAAFQQAIEQGSILPGTRVPPERSLAKALALSRTTVLTAYNNLKQDGWLESRTGSGTWVGDRRASAARHRTHAAVVSGASTVNLLQIDGAAVVDFAVGVTAPLAELPRELFAVDAATQNALLAERSYMPLGLPRLRAAIARYYTTHGLPTESEQILITSGAQQALSLITSLYIQRGDAVLVENPTYFGALDVFRLAGARLSPVPVAAEHVRASVLRDRLLSVGHRLMYLTPTYQNPTGAIMPESTRQSVAALADEFGIPVIEDHTLSELTVDGTPPGPIARYSKAGTVLTVGSMSKLFWAALRVGWVRAPVAAIAQLARVKTGSDLGSALLTQAIAVQLLSVLDRAKEMRREQLLRRRDLLASLLREKLPEWEFSLPKGGLCLWVRLPSGDARTFAQCAARHGVAVISGSIFAADESYEDYLRIPFVLDEESLALGVDRLATAWTEYRGLARTQPARSAPIV
ncbi:MAG: PLP-dependent aminotransferase family protein [Bryobacteraceae bacterium]|jgi:DNA-binding transcriptional MocR family regulator